MKRREPDVLIAVSRERRSSRSHAVRAVFDEVDGPKMTVGTKVSSSTSTAEPDQACGGAHFFRKAATSAGPSLTLSSNSPFFWAYTTLPSGSSTARLGMRT